jgi:hypothetical protein
LDLQEQQCQKEDEKVEEKNDEEMDQGKFEFFFYNFTFCRKNIYNDCRK